MSQTAYLKSQAAKVESRKRTAAIQKAARQIVAELQYGAHYGEYHPEVLISALEPLSEEDRVKALSQALFSVSLGRAEIAQLVINCLAYANVVIDAVTADSPTRPLPDAFAVLRESDDETEPDEA